MKRVWYVGRLCLNIVMLLFLVKVSVLDAGLDFGVAHHLICPLSAIHILFVRSIAKVLYVFELFYYENA